MNIFVLDLNPARAARYHMDTHFKMILESGEMLSTAHRLIDGHGYTEKTKSNRSIKRWALPDSREQVLYKATHVNHPCSIWARENDRNYLWLFSLFLALCDEYTYRTGKTHKTDRELSSLLSDLPHNIPKAAQMTPFAQAMPDEFKDNDPVVAYRKYYQFKADTISRVSWSNRSVPHFISLPGE